MIPRGAIRGTELILMADPCPNLATYVEAAAQCLRSFSGL
jgi:hypothetical protein